MKVKQVELFGVENWQPNPDPNQQGKMLFTCNGMRMVCWLKEGDKVKVGSIIDLKNVPGIWYVDKINKIEMDHKEINYTWYAGGNEFQAS